MKTQQLTGMFITFEGPEGSGKSTHANLLASYLREQGYDVVMVHEPGGTAIGNLIREILQHDKTGEPVSAGAETLLFEASRAQLVSRVILPALTDGKIVVCDRFFDSTTAYQGYGRGLDMKKILALNEFATGGIKPDLTILMDIDVTRGFERVASRNAQKGMAKDRIEREAISFHEKVRAGYLDLAKSEAGRFKVLDAGRKVEIVDGEIRKIVADGIENMRKKGRFGGKA